MCWFSPAENAIQSIFVLCATRLHGEANQRGTRNTEVAVNYRGGEYRSMLAMNNFAPEDKEAWKKGGVGKKATNQEGATRNEIVPWSLIAAITACGMSAPVWWMARISGTHPAVPPASSRSPGAPCAITNRDHTRDMGSSATSPPHGVEQSTPTGAGLQWGAAALRSWNPWGLHIKSFPSDRVSMVLGAEACEKLGVGTAPLGRVSWPSLVQKEHGLRALTALHDTSQLHANPQVRQAPHRAR